ncbi:MAG: YfhO family protein [Verrucomicrobia bacterium]|nr:YfhO family protein [Verrucomicrobiota bacterium]
MKSQPPDSSLASGFRTFAMMAGGLSLLLLFLFHDSLDARKTLFSNDGPLGAIASEQSSTAAAFTGAWGDLNWIGNKLPSAAPDVTSLLSMVLGPLLYSKFGVPCALLILGLSAWAFFRQLGFNPVVCAIGGFAIALNTDPFSYACWGLASLPLTLAATFLGLAALGRLSPGRGWLRAVVAGCAVGLGIMEGFDTGAILSLYVAAFAMFQYWHYAKRSQSNPQVAVAFVGAIALAAAVTSAHTLSTLIDTQIQGVSEPAPDQGSKEEQWNGATQWSLPKIETLRIIIPGLFGYRMDTPDGGNYWGAVGRQPGWEEHKQGLIRHSGSGTYAGIVVVLLAMWGVHQSLRRENGFYSEYERRAIWFWGAVALISLAFSFGRHAPFYQFIYSLPYFSTIRNPIKFLHPFHMAIVVLFAYGLQGLWRRHAQSDSRKSQSFKEHLRLWWASADRWDRKWTSGSVGFVLLSLLGWLLFSSSTRELQRHLASVGFSDPITFAGEIARFSISEVGWYVLFLALAVALTTIISSGWFGGARMKLAAILLGALLIADFARANSPWVIYYDYKEKYALNPVLDILKTNPHDRRVTGRVHPINGPHLENGQVPFSGVYESWLQHQFQYYNIQSLDIVQMPRMPQFDKMFIGAFTPTSANQLGSIGRLWQITNTRYLLGMKGFLDLLNEQVDPIQHRFRVHTAFAFTPKNPASPGGITRIEDITAVVTPEGPLALFEFTGALPRAKLYSHWQAASSDQAALSQLSNPAFDPETSVLIADSIDHAPSMAATNALSAGTVTIQSYRPKNVGLETESDHPTVLLFNDKYHPDWKVYVDGKLDTLLRCNYAMRGVFLPQGRHSVEFRFAPPAPWLYVSLISVFVALTLCIVFFFSSSLGKARKLDSAGASERPKTKT